MKIRIIGLLAFLLVSCSKQETNPCDNIVIIFESPLHQNSFITPNGTVLKNENAGVISYIKQGRIAKYTPSNIPDTLVIYNTNGNLEISLPYLNVEDWFFLIQQGDTVTISTNELNEPYVESKTSKELTKAYNLYSHIENRQIHLGLEPLTFLLNHGSYFRRLAESPTLAPNIYEKYKKDYISIEILKQSFLAYVLNFKTKINSLDKKEFLSYVNYYSYILKMKEYLYYISCFYFENSSNEGIDIESFFSDDYADYSSYHNYIGYYLFYYYLKNKNISSIKSANGQEADWKECFDLIFADTIYPPKTKGLMLNICLDNIIKVFNGNDLQLYLDKYLSLTGDSATISILKEKYNLNFARNDELILQDMYGNQTTLKKVLDQHRGKIVYVDFWASWCAPCKHSMPFAKKLRESYKGKDIIFLYIGYNDAEATWKKEIVNQGIDDLAENYLILNHKTASYIIDHEINSIPRYMIYGRNGELINQNAPRPESHDIKEVLNNILLN